MTSNRLAHLAHVAAEQHGRYKRASAEAVTAYLAAGAALAEAKAACRHGQWLPWLKETGIPERTAQRMIRLAASGMKSDIVTDLGGVGAALAHLASPAETFRLPADLRRIADIEYRKDLDPRLWRNPGTVRAYVAAMTEPLFPGDGEFPPVEINQHNVLVDGWYRLAAYREAGRTEIAVTVTETADDDEHLGLALERNSGGGLVLTAEDRRHVRLKLSELKKATRKAGK